LLKSIKKIKKCENSLKWLLKTSNLENITSYDELNEQRAFRESLILPIVFVALLWLIHLAKIVFNLRLRHWGIYPMQPGGLQGIITGPLVHGDIPHLFSNSVPLLLLGVTTIYFYRRVAIPAIGMIYILTGFAVWIFGRPVYHIGASGIVYGLVAFLFWNGIFLKNRTSLVLSLIVLMMYGGLFLGVLPDQPGISWEGHLFGAFSGVFASFWYKDELREIQRQQTVTHEAKTYFLPRDTFDHKRYDKNGNPTDGIDPPAWYTTRT